MPEEEPGDVGDAEEWDEEDRPAGTEDADSRTREGRRRRGVARFLLLEGLIVVLSVLVALAVDEWREEAALREDVEVARQRVMREAARNLRELVETDSVVSARRSRLVAIIDTIAPSGRAFAQFVPTFGGFRLPDLSTAAWERLSRSSLGDRLHPTLLEDAFQLYDGMDELELLGGQVAELTFSTSYFRPEQAEANAQVARQIMDQQLAWIEDLVAEHCAFLATYGDPEAPAPAGCPPRQRGPAEVR